MLVAVAILAILAGLAAPSFQTFVQNARIRSTAESMQTGLTLARSEALRRNTQISFWIVSDITSSCALTSSGQSWVVSFDSPEGHCADSASDTNNPRIIQTGESANNSSGVSINALSAAGVATSCITFNGLGRAQPQCIGSSGDPIGQIQFVSTNAPATTRNFRVLVDAGGGARICDPSKTGIAGC
jgi:type IV fimbrial biogenesis protein FimT